MVQLKGNFMVAPPGMNEYLESLIEGAANSKEWSDIETADKKHLTAEQAREEFKKSLREPLLLEKFMMRGQRGIKLIMEHIGSYPNDRLCLKEFDRAMSILETSPNMLQEAISQFEKSEDEFRLPEPTSSQLNLSAETLNVFYDIGYKLYEENRTEEAICVFTFLSSLFNFSPQVWLSLGLSHHRAGEWIPAILALTIATLLESENPIPYLCSIECFLALNNKKAAAEALEMAKDVITDETKEHFAPAVEHYEHAIHQHP